MKILTLFNEEARYVLLKHRIVFYLGFYKSLDNYLFSEHILSSEILEALKSKQAFGTFEHSAQVSSRTYKNTFDYMWKAKRKSGRLVSFTIGCCTFEGKNLSRLLKYVRTNR